MPLSPHIPVNAFIVKWRLMFDLGWWQSRPLPWDTSLPTRSISHHGMLWEFFDQTLHFLRFCPLALVLGTLFNPMPWNMLTKVDSDVVAAVLVLSDDPFIFCLSNSCCYFLWCFSACWQVLPYLRSASWGSFPLILNPSNSWRKPLRPATGLEMRNVPKVYRRQRLPPPRTDKEVWAFIHVITLFRSHGSLVVPGILPVATGKSHRLQKFYEWARSARRETK